MTRARDALVELFREHCLTGGTRWDSEHRTTFSLCECGERCYLVTKELPSFEEHLADLVVDLLGLPTSVPRRAPSLTDEDRARMASQAPGGTYTARPRSERQTIITNDDKENDA